MDEERKRATGERNFRDEIERFAHMAPDLALVAVALYAVGFLVVNAYLAQYGVRDIDPVRSRYVAAALPFLVLTAFSAILAFDLDPTKTKAFAEAQLLRRVWLVLRNGFFIILAAATLQVIALSYLGAVPLLDPQRLLAYWLGLISFNGGLAMVTAGIRRARPRGWIGWIGSVQSLTALSGMLVVLSSYVATVYPSLPTYLGGGKGDTVRLVVDESLKGLCPPCFAEEPIQLIDQDNDRVIVQFSQGDQRRTVEIARQYVRGIIHTGSPSH
jgi:hypothetical protein